MQQTRFYKIKYTLHSFRDCKYEGAKYNDYDCEDIIEETTRAKAIKFLNKKYSYKTRKERQDIIINQVIDL
jgi:hypothetical protein